MAMTAVIRQRVLDAGFDAFQSTPRLSKSSLIFKRCSR
jgi:hypothetical protein